MQQRCGLHVAALPPPPPKKNPLRGAESVGKAATFATIWCNELAVTIQHILQEITLKTGAFMARALISRRAHHGERRASSAVKKGQTWKRRIRKGSENKELAEEGVQYEAEEPLNSRFDFNPWFSSTLLLQ